MNNRLWFIIAAVMLFAGGFYVRGRNVTSANNQLASIQSLDAAGSDTTAAVANLKNYVKGHMGASAKFTLTGSYQRAANVANAAAAAQAANARVYAAAQAACSGHTDSITQAECNQRYLAQHLTGNSSATGSTTPPPLADYEYNLMAPIWTPDAAGILLAGGVLALGLAFFYPRRRYH